MKFELPPLPYDYAALEPAISAETMHTHHDKHHQAYVDKLNELVAGTKYENMKLEEIVLGAKGSDKKIFNNAAQAWSHTFFWNCLTPKPKKMTNGLNGMLSRARSSSSRPKNFLAPAGFG